MLDKVDVRIPEGTQPGPALAEAFQQLRSGRPVPSFRPSKYYKYVCDLRQDFDVDAVVHIYLRFGKQTHKVEIIDAGKKTVSAMAAIIEQLFQVEPWTLGLMRVDLAADVEGVPVPWFQQHAFVSRKQFSSSIKKSSETKVQFVGMGNAVAQTIYAGKRPCLIRIYNKLAEWRMQWRKQDRSCKRFNSGMSGLDLSPEQMHYGARHSPTFGEFCKTEGYEYGEGKVLTRIERQIGGARFPADLKTFGDLCHAHEVAPFSGLRLVGEDSIVNLESPPEGVAMRNWLAAIGLGALEKQLGSAQLARAIVLKHGRGNGTRILESLADSISPSRPTLSMLEVKESYRQSTLIQTSQSK